MRIRGKHSDMAARSYPDNPKTEALTGRPRKRFQTKSHARILYRRLIDKLSILTLCQYT